MTTLSSTRTAEVIGFLAVGGVIVGIGLAAWHVGVPLAAVWEEIVSRIPAARLRRAGEWSVIALSIGVPAGLMPYLLFVNHAVVAPSITVIFAVYVCVAVVLILVFAWYRLRRRQPLHIGTAAPQMS